MTISPHAHVPCPNDGKVKTMPNKNAAVFPPIARHIVSVAIAVLMIQFFPTSAIAGIESDDEHLKIGGDIRGPDLMPFLMAFGTAIKKTAATGKPLRLELNSDGGDIETAFFMADAIEAAQQSGRIIQVEVPEGGRCNSACVVIFAAGKKRWAAPDSEFLLHGVSYAGFSESPTIALTRQKYVENFHKAIEGADWQFGQFVRRHGIIENDLNMSFSGRQLYEAFGSFITSLNTVRSD
ncbi:ATP-dependent Clp protease proteolytic subunit [Hwanghaeella grinnelliae]|nr:ATP-dependent Clp protease proteolytic subunit [Hwanghaeella grinnelliae]